MCRSAFSVNRGAGTMVAASRHIFQWICFNWSLFILSVSAMSMSLSTAAT